MTQFNQTTTGIPSMVYDYVVVGSGPAGCVIAKRLSDNNRFSVLLLEAGGNEDNNPLIRDSNVTVSKYFPQFFWQGRTTPQKKLNNRSFNWTTGRIVGGGSSVNGQMYVRPSVAVLKKWESLLGPAWSVDRCLDSLRSMENVSPNIAKPSRGQTGRIHIQAVPNKIPSITQKFVSAMVQGIGIPEIEDYNDPATPLGAFARWQLYQKPNGERESASTAFLTSDIIAEKGYGVNGRQLRLLTRATATKILMNQQSAAGVEFLKEGVFARALVRKGVVISSGINSTQLLQISGIGDANILRQLQIPVVVDNKNVGKNLRNHTLGFVRFTVPEEDINEQIEPNAKYFGGAFLSLKNSNSNSNTNADMNGDNGNPVNDTINYSDRIVQLIGLLMGNQFTILVQDLLPKSHGTIQVQSNDPLQIVLADEAIFSDEEDLLVMKEIYRKHIIPIAKELEKNDGYTLTSPTWNELSDEVLLENFIKRTYGQNQHQQEMLRMAPLDEGGVVDAQGLVYGTRGLYVADASIFPFTVDGNTAAPAFMVGDIIAQQIVDRNQ